MGIGGIGIWQLLVILLIVVVIFGPKRIRNIGSDLGHALKSFRSAVNDPEAESNNKTEEPAALESKDSEKADAKFKEEAKTD